MGWRYSKERGLQWSDGQCNNWQSLYICQRATGAVTRLISFFFYENKYHCKLQITVILKQAVFTNLKALDKWDAILSNGFYLYNDFKKIINTCKYDVIREPNKQSCKYKNWSSSLILVALVHFGLAVQKDSIACLFNVDCSWPGNNLILGVPTWCQVTLCTKSVARRPVLKIALINYELGLLMIIISI